MDYSSLTLKKLQQLSKREGIPTKGSKQELISGLVKLQKPAIELIVANLPQDVIAPAAPAPIIEAPVAPAPAPTVENVSSYPAAAMETLTPAAAIAAALRTSSRVRRPRICTMCVGCHQHPTPMAGKVTRQGATAVVDDASIVDLAEKFAVVNIVPERQPNGNASVPDANVAAPVKPSAKTSKPRTTTSTTTRAPLQTRSNQATVEGVAVVDAKHAKSAKGKSTITKKKVGFLKDLAAAAGNGKENLPSGIEVAKVTTERPGRKVRSLKQVIA